MNFSSGVSLEKLRFELIKLEDSILFSLIERSGFKQNAIIYKENAFEFKEGYKGSFLSFFLSSVEKVHAQVRRYTSPDELPFTSPLPDPVLPPLEFPPSLAPNTVNLNEKLLDAYVKEMIPMVCKPGDDRNYGSSATRDVEILQILSHRIHLGKFVAEAKFNDPAHHDTYVRLIQSKDRQGLLTLLTNKPVEEKLLARLRKKALVYGQEITLDQVGNLKPVSEENLKISLEVVTRIFEEFVIPLTKEVEVEYLLQRLDHPEFESGVVWEYP